VVFGHRVIPANDVNEAMRDAEAQTSSRNTHHTTHPYIDLPRSRNMKTSGKSCPYGCVGIITFQERYQ
jgi:hypothetical protein